MDGRNKVKKKNTNEFIEEALENIRHDTKKEKASESLTDEDKNELFDLIKESA
jgi:hypothetical protein